MIHGFLSLADWKNQTPQGDSPESVYQDDSLRLFFYGEIYNRDSFPDYASVTNADLASILFREEETASLALLDGCFTIIYYTSVQCGIVRDHHGLHQSVYYNDSGEFSTSWQQITSHPEPNLPSLSCFLRHGLMQSDSFVVKNIHSLPAGWHCLVRSDKGVVSKPMYIHTTNPEIDTDPAHNENYYVSKYLDLHKQAIKRRIQGAKNVGILLSGGYDSNSNLVALRSVYNGEIKSYSVGFKGDTCSELPYARLMSDKYGTIHHEYEMDGSEIEFLPEIVRFLEAPFVEGGLMLNYCAMRMIGEDKPSVLLGGDGSDQYFGTAGREIALFYLTGRAKMHPMMRGIKHFLCKPLFDDSETAIRIRFHIDQILNILEGERFGFNRRELYRLLQCPFIDYPHINKHQADLTSIEHLYNQRAILSDMEIVINRIILFKASRMSQMFGQHLTFPYVDIDLYKFLQELPMEYKCKSSSVWKMARGHLTSKYLLKKCYKPLLPPEITMRKKQGGFAPMAMFFNDQVRCKRINDFILSSSIFRNYLDKEAVEQFVTTYAEKQGKSNIWFWHRQNLAIQYFNLLTLIIWWEEFVEQKSVSLK